jgi:signal transduction histidine kinase
MDSARLETSHLGGSLDPGQLGRLLEVGRSLVAVRDPDEVLMRVLEVARELTGAQYAAMGILDDDKSGLARFLTVGVDEDLRRRIGPLPRGHGILGELIRTPRPLRLAHLGEHPRSYGFPAEHPPMETFLGVPVMIRGEVYGNLYLTEKTGGGEFDESDEELLVVLADWAAVAVDNARTHAASQGHQRDLERAMRGLEASASLNREIVGRADLERINELVVKRGRALSGGRTASLLLLEKGGLKIAAVAGEVAAEAIGSDAAAGGVALSLDVLRAGRGQVISPSVAAQYAKLNPQGAAGVVVPLRARGVDLGVLAVFDRLDDQRSFTPDDVLALEVFAASAAAALGAAQALEDEHLRLSIASSERERRRWARELHDETLQELGALNVMQESALKIDDADAMRSALGRSKQQVEQIISGLQGLITELRPAALDQLGPEAAVETLIDRLKSRSGLDIDLDVDLAYESGRAPTRHTPELEATLYRLVQEALTNVIKHADATRARVRIEEDDETVSVTVEDDGNGFDGDTDHDGFGLLGMRERVALLGGDLTVTSSPGDGTRVAAELPVERVGGLSD